MAVIKVTSKGLVLEEVAEGYTVDNVLANTEADLITIKGEDRCRNQISKK